MYARLLTICEKNFLNIRIKAEYNPNDKMK